MVTTLTGAYSAARLLKYHVAESLAFQTEVGAANAAAALAYVGVMETNEADLPIPRATVQRGTHRRMPGDGALGFTTEADFTIIFEFLIPAASSTDVESEGNYFMNLIGDIMAEVEALVDTTGDVGGLNPLRINKHWVTDGPDKITDEDRAHVDSSPEPNLSAWFVCLGVTIG